MSRPDYFKLMAPFDLSDYEVTAAMLLKQTRTIYSCGGPIPRLQTSGGAQEKCANSNVQAVFNSWRSKARMPLRLPVTGVEYEADNYLQHIAWPDFGSDVKPLAYHCVVDLQSLGPTSTSQPEEFLDSEELLQTFLASKCDASPKLVCEIELAPFSSSQNQRILPALKDYVLMHRHSAGGQMPVAVGSAVRKCIAIMPPEEIEQLATWIKPDGQKAVPVEVEIEIAKMVYRYFEVNSLPQSPPLLATELLDMATLYMSPRLIVQEKYATAASLAVSSLFAMQNDLAEAAWSKVASCSQSWFREIIEDDIASLREKWRSRVTEQQWLDQVTTRIGMFQGR